MMARDTCGLAYRRCVGAVAALAAVAVLVAGCGGSTTKSATSGTTAATTAPSGSTAAGSSSATTGAASATTTPGGATTTVTVAAVKTGSLGSSFCQASGALKKREAAEEKGFADTPQALEKLEKEGVAELPEFERLAPSSLKSAVEVLVTEDRLVFSELQKANFNYAKLPPNFIQAFEAPKFTQATDQITNYLTHVCGISPNS
jgi:hypothetical protein